MCLSVMKLDCDARLITEPVTADDMEQRKSANNLKAWEYAVQLALQKQKINDGEGSAVLQCWKEADVSIYCASHQVPSFFYSPCFRAESSRYNGGEIGKV